MRGPSRVLFDNLCIEFEAAWNAMATSELADHTDGCFLFARQVMLLVELASTVAEKDQATFRRFSQELQRREPLLFKRIPYRPGRGTHPVPRIAPQGDPTSELIALLFDLARNGHAHYGHQIYAPLKDGGAVGVVLYGVNKNETIDKVHHGNTRPFDHLQGVRQSGDRIVITVSTGTLYVNVRDASEAAGVWDLDADASQYVDARAQDITADELEAALVDRAGPYMLMGRASPSPHRPSTGSPS